MTESTPTPTEQMAAIQAAEREAKVRKLAEGIGETYEFTADQVTRLIASFVGLPGVTSAPLIMGPDYYFDVAVHQIELGVRVTAEPIKTYEVPTDAGGTGKYVYVDESAAPESPQERYKRLAQAHQEIYEQAVADRKAAKRKGKS